MNKLYQTKENPVRYGTFLVVNSTGKLVLEMKGGGSVEAFDPADVEEVRPYTVGVQFLGGGHRLTAYHYYAEKGAVEVGDIVVIGNGIARVKNLDTKSDAETKWLTGKKLVTTKLSAPKDALVGDTTDDDN